ncbi:unnamed protein product [Acanthoscelides obtectus]|uniref:Uncharacterized protein n=1 Tax=Acanthoscelides obtectus TaxID=200917 RepID=A0A9P0LN32_ACAOB|nr:unnamed protein product [Acanthoscelides obtectus]CAK1630173.1 hypothetical protein AOBTE_LOCUS6191 [Acanthoscelides obtectus]
MRMVSSSRLSRNTRAKGKLKK